jgi:L-fuconolactonase
VADTIAEWAATNGAAGIRIMMNRDVSTDPADPGIKRVLAAAARHALPVNFLCAGLLGSASRASGRGDSLPHGRGESDLRLDGRGGLEQVVEIAKQNPDNRLVIDHLGLLQPTEPPGLPEPFAELPRVLAVAKYDNVAIKITGACTLSHKAFPYRDIWDPLGRIFDAFGLERCMWGTDWTRAVGVLTYEQGVEAFRVTDRLSDTDRAALMGETLQRIYRWSPSMTA